jgi:transposase
MFIRLAEAVGGGIVAGVYVAFQAAAPDMVKDLGLPIAFLLLVIAALRVLWRANERKDEKMEAIAKEFSETVKVMAAEHTTAFNKLSEEFRTRRTRQ